MTAGYRRPEPTAHPQSEWPRKYLESTIPLSPHHCGSITIPATLTVAEWEAVERFMAVLKTVAISSDLREGNQE